MGTEKLEELVQKIRKGKNGFDTGLKINEIYNRLSSEAREKLHDVLAKSYEKIHYYDDGREGDETNKVGKINLKEKFGDDKMARYFIAHECALINGATIIIDRDGVIELYKK
jgi:hypothetical protein